VQRNRNNEITRYLELLGDEGAHRAP
jgi:hypothetical protein